MNTAPKKILYIVTQSEFGGAQRYVFDLAHYFVDHGHEVTVAAGGNGELFKKLLEKNISTIPLRHLHREINPLHDIAALRELRSIIKSLKPDIIHLNSTKAGILGSIAAKNSKAKIIYTVHGFAFHEPLRAWKKQVYITAERKTAKYKDAIICVSSYDMQSGIQHHIAPANKFVTIHNGIVAEENYLAREIARKEIGLNQTKTFVIGTIAHFYKTKGLEYLINALTLIRKEIPTIQCVLIGSGPEEPTLRQRIREKKLEHVVILAGARLNASRYLKAFDVFALPSVKEGLPYVLIEAMAAQLPIVATKVGGVPELIIDGKTGLLVKPGDPKELSTAIIQLAKNKNQQEKLSSQAFHHFEKNFTIEKMLTTTEHIYLKK